MNTIQCPPGLAISNIFTPTRPAGNSVLDIIIHDTSLKTVDTYVFDFPITSHHLALLKIMQFSLKLRSCDNKHILDEKRKTHSRCKHYSTDEFRKSVRASDWSNL